MEITVAVSTFVQTPSGVLCAAVGMDLPSTLTSELVMVRRHNCMVSISRQYNRFSSINRNFNEGCTTRQNNTTTTI